MFMGTLQLVPTAQLSGCVQAPAMHTSFVHVTESSVQIVASSLFEYAVVDIAERHARHSPAGSVAPSVMQAPPMRQPVETVPPPHAPAVHVVPVVHERASSHAVASSLFE
jgi:hypothetical protein